MNSFEYGFFSELEKTATNKDEVAQWRSYLAKMYPELKGASRGYIGGIANMRAQRALGTSGTSERPTTDPRFHSDNFRFDISIPKPGQPGKRIVANREQRQKYLSRGDSPLSPANVIRDNMTAPKRAKYGEKPFGL